MADYDSQLPVRSKQDVDERVLVKIQDGDSPDGVNETMTVSEKKAHVRLHAKDSDGTDQEVLLSQEGHVQSNGDYDIADNKRPSSQGLITSDRSAAPDETTMNKRTTSVAGNDDKVAMDVAISDSSGNRFDENNPLPVYNTEDPGTEVTDFDETVNAAGGALEHNYTTAGEFRSLNIEASASGKAKFELQVETTAGGGTFDTIGVQFNSTANPNVKFELKRPKAIATGVIVKLIKTNLDNQPQSIYSTINGVEV